MMGLWHTYSKGTGMKKHLWIFAIPALLFSAPALAVEYKYAYADGEYVVTLPDAPTGETIWAQKDEVPYLDNPPKHGAVGEVVRMKRVDPDTGDIFDFRSTTIRASRDFLLELTEAKIQDTLKREFSDLTLQSTKFNLSQGSSTLKWGTYSGFSVSENNDVLYNIAHYLVGESSLTVMRVSYNVRNQEYNGYYKTLAKSIMYMGR